MNTKLICTGLLGLAVLMSPAALAQAAAPAAPGTAAVAAANTVGAALAKLPHVNGIAPNTHARYYFFVCSASWCGPCRAIMPKVVEQYTEIKATGDVEVVLVNFDRSPEEAKAYADHYKMPFSMVMYEDLKEQHAIAFPDVHGIPHAVLINGEGRMMGQGHGSLMLHWKDAIKASEAATNKTVMLYAEQPALAQVGNSPKAKKDKSADKKAKKAKKKKAKKNKGKPVTEVGEAIAGLNYLNEYTPNPKAKYFVYLSSAGWCGPCRALAPQIIAAYESMPDKDVELILVSQDQNEEKGREYAEHYGCPAIMHTSAGSLPGYKPSQGIPWAIIVNGKGEVLSNDHGQTVLQWENIIAKDPSAGDDASDDDEAAPDDDEDAADGDNPKKKKKKGSKKKKK